MKYIIVTMIFIFALLISIFIRMKTLKKRRHIFDEYASIPISDLVELFDEKKSHDLDETKEILINIAKYIKIDVGKLRPSMALCEIMNENSPFDDNFLEIEIRLMEKNIKVDFCEIDIKFLVDLFRRSGKVNNHSARASD